MAEELENADGNKIPDNLLLCQMFRIIYYSNSEKF